MSILSKISLLPEVVDGIVFWTKNSVPMLDRLTELERYIYSGFIFKNRYGMVISPHCINRAIERICRDYNAQEQMSATSEQREPVLTPHFTVHQLRHTFCTRFCENETNIKVIQEIMGHADISTTMNIYNEATMEKRIEAIENLESKIKID